MRRRPWVAAALGLLLTSCTAAEGDPTGSAPGSDRSSAAPVPIIGEIIGELDAGGAGWGMAKAGGALWIQVDPPIDAIVRIDVATGAAVPAIPGGVDVKFGDEGLWVACCDGIARVDPATGELLLVVPLDGAFALSNGSVFALSEQGLQEIDPQSGAPLDEPIGSAVDRTVCGAWKDLIVAFGSAWLACKEGTVVRIDIDSGRLRSITTGAGAHTFTVTDDAVWVTNYQAGSVSRIDPETDQVTTIKGAGSGVGITSGGGYVWAAARTGIAKIDPATSAIVATIDLGPGEYYELVWDDGVIWVSTRGSRILKVDPSATP
jgi:streptogramin lyase